jgi:HrpA-like RNA helicase
VSVDADEEHNIVGCGDHHVKKEAEKLAALSAVLQLAHYGLLDRPRVKGAATSGAPGAAAAPANAAAETATLADGTELSADRARQFMEYYCNRYKFGKPEIEFTSAQTRLAPRGFGKKKPHTELTWEAVMSVGGRKIGMGGGTNKKAAQVRCYLDVTQYLDSCDPQLWADFVEASKKDPSLSLGMAPHLVFQMSDALDEEVQGLCTDIRHSLLLHNAPPANQALQAPSQLPVWNAGRRRFNVTPDFARKSKLLQEQLEQYSIDPKLERMRNDRASLPVQSRASDILAKIEVNDVTIVMAATGSGKTTQVPQLIFDDYIHRGEGSQCNIICTQPRRLAAMSVAERVADERGQSLGHNVGYQVRFDAKIPEPHGSITFCTTGIFLKRMQSSLGSTAHPDSVKSMDEITHIVVDEVHERDIDTDLLLVVLKRLLADRRARKKPLKVILMSATIDPTLFQSYFADDRGRPAPVAEVPGRTFPVDKRYLDDFIVQLRDGLQRHQGGWVFQDSKVAEYITKELSPNPANFVLTTGIAGGELEIPYPLVALTIAHVLRQSDDGHVLVFLPGWDEIKRVADILLDHSGQFPLLGLNFSDASKFSIHYLHSTIPAAEQREVFNPPPPGVRRIILATNIAETSITIPDVVYVVDSGRVKEKRYDPDRHMSSLVSAWVGSSNIGQRAGRAGRHRSGEYFGLLSKMRLESLNPHQLVEMKRSDLSNVVMHVKALNLGEVENVLAECIEPPGSDRIVAALETLHMLGAIDSHKNLTPLGRVLLQLPTDAAIGKLCLFGSFFRCLGSALTLAAVLTNRDPFLAPLPRKAEADAIKDSWSPRAFRSDPLAVVSAYNVWVEMYERGSHSQANQFCSDNFLSKPTLLQIKQVKESLLQSLDQAGVIAVSAGGNVGWLGRRAEVPMALRENDHSLPLLAALIAMASAPNFAIRTSDKTCRTSQDKHVFIHGSSVNSRKREVGGPEMPSASFNPAEKRIYAFGEKTRNIPPGGTAASAMTQLRNTTRLDPMTYMLFGAYDLAGTSRGLECDGWLPVTGNVYALDDVQRLKTLLDACLLRVFEGVGKALTMGRDQRFAASRNTVDVRHGSSRITNQSNLDDDKENESDDEEPDEMAGASGTMRLQYEMSQRSVRKVEPLSVDEINELQMLTTDVVRILDSYAHEREGVNSAYSSRPATPSNLYRPPGVRGPPRPTMRW